MNQVSGDSSSPVATDDRIKDEILLKIDNVSLSFGGVKAIQNVSFDIKKGEVRAIIGPNGAGKTSMLNSINGFYHPQEGTITYRGQTRRQMRPYIAATQGIARTFQNVALFRGMSTLDNIMSGRTLKMKTGLFWQMLRKGPAEAGRDPPSRVRRAHHRLSWRSRQFGERRSAACPTACKSASSLVVPWRWSRPCCCSMSRWPV